MNEMGSISSIDLLPAVSNCCGSFDIKYDPQFFKAVCNQCNQFTTRVTQNEWLQIKIKRFLDATIK